MTKTYAVLQKKLQELEHQLSHNNFPPSNFHPSNPLSQENHQKLLFIANLLSAETASCPTKPPRHLKHIAHRLAQLEAAFRDARATEEYCLPDHVDDSSTCSCTESCLNDDGDEEEASSCLDDEEGEFYECVEDDHEKKEEKKFVGIGKFCGALASGFFIGMAVSFIEVFGYFHVQPNGGFVTPT